MERQPEMELIDKKHLLILLFLLSFQIVFSQTKKIEGDTVFWFKRNKVLQQTLELKDFEKSTDEFNFRFRDHRQVIEITKNNSVISGTITNYIRHTKKETARKHDTLSSKIILSPEKARSVYNIIQNSEILNLPSGKKIKDWKRGLDGVTYIVEHSDKENYWFKNYWTPSAQDSIPEVLIFMDLEKKLSDTLNLKETFTKFRYDLPRYGCYISGMIVSCHFSNYIEFGYSGAAKLPLGFYSSIGATYLGEKKMRIGAALQYNFDNNGFYHLNLQTYKKDILARKSSLSDYIAYNYQNRKLDIDDINNEFHNHQIKYGLDLKNNMNIGVGLDYLIKKEYEKAGAHFHTYKWFSKPKIGTSLTSSLFNNQFNYEIEALRAFVIHRRSTIRGVSVGLAYTEFMDYKDLYFKFLILI